MRPAVSRRCQHLITMLICDKADRLCSRRYGFKDMQASLSSSGATNVGSSPMSSSIVRGRDFAGRYVFPYDAEDIKAHKWFKGVPWDRLHELPPPFIPQLRSEIDTQYFEEDEPVSDWDSSSDSDSSASTDSAAFSLPQGPQLTALGGLDGITVAAGEASTDSRVVNNLMPQSPGGYVGNATRPPSARALAREARMRCALAVFPAGVQRLALSWVAVPHDSSKLKTIYAHIETLPGLFREEKVALKQFVRGFGKKEKKRPRDRLLRDRKTKAAVMELRKRNAFLGYTWRRIQVVPSRGEWWGASGGG